MPKTRTLWKVRALGVLALLVLAAWGVVTAQTPTPIVLEDFSSLRTNYDSPPGPLWQVYLNPSGGADYANQTGTVENGTFHLFTVGRPYFQFAPYPYVDPHGFAKQNLRSGTWNPNVNRFRFWLKTTANIPRRADGGSIAEVGTYTKKADGNASNQGDHYYHYLTANFVANQWMLITLNRTPQHQVGNDAVVPDNPTAARGWQYYDGLTRFYFCDEYGSSSVWRGDYYFADFQFDLVSGEPDTLVATVAAVYTGNHYELSWQGPRNVVQAYTVRYATSSMHQNGLGVGTVAGGTVQTSGSDYSGVIWSSPAIAQPSGGMYFAIQPNGQSAFTEIYLPNGPYTGSGTTPPTGAPPAPTNIRIVP